MTNSEPAAPALPAESSVFFDFSRTDNRRSFALLAAGALLGLGIAGYGLFSAKGTSSNRLPAEDIALVNQKPIYRSDFVIQTQNEFSVPFGESTIEQRRKVLDDMINEELMVQRGIEVDLPGYDPNVRAALVSGVELQMYAGVLAKQPSEEELRAYYQAHRDKYSSIGVMRIRDLTVVFRPDENSDQMRQRAQAAVAALRRGAALDDAFLSAQGLQDSGRLAQGGKTDLGDIFDFAAQARLGAKLYAAAQKLKAGEVSDPIDDAGETHIVVMNLRKPPQAMDYAAVRPRVWTDIDNEAQDKIRTATLKYLRDKADILSTEDY